MRRERCVEGERKIVRKLPGRIVLLCCGAEEVVTRRTTSVCCSSANPRSSPGHVQSPGKREKICGRVLLCRLEGQLLSLVVVGTHMLGVVRQLVRLFG